MPLISESYRQQQETLHSTGAYGTLGAAYAPLVAEVINKLEVTHLLDYGCGSNLSLPKAMVGKVTHKIKYQAYDPCVAKYASPPVPAEMVACIDVLEHIEPESIDAVLDHLRELTEAVGFFSVNTGPAIKTLPDGRNAHLLQMPKEWWLIEFMKRFDVQTFQVTAHDSFYVIVYAEPRAIEGTDGQKLS